MKLQVPLSFSEDGVLRYGSVVQLESAEVRALCMTDLKEKLLKTTASLPPTGKQRAPAKTGLSGGTDVPHGQLLIVSKRNCFEIASFPYVRHVVYNPVFVSLQQ